MGYDFSYVSTPAGEAEAVAAARKVFDAAVAERDALPREEAGRFDPARARELGDPDAHGAFVGRTERYIHAQDKVSAAYAEMDKARRSYFRLNVWGMGAFGRIMAELGMVFEDEPYPPFPDPDDYGTTAEDVWAADNPDDYPEQFAALTPERLEKANACLAEQRRVLSFHGMADTPGIPAHKFGTNDGWRVLPAECEAAVRIWEKALAERGEDAMRGLIGNRLYDYWLRWIEYLRGAARCDGFEVW